MTVTNDASVLISQHARNKMMLYNATSFLEYKPSKDEISRQISAPINLPVSLPSPSVQ